MPVSSDDRRKTMPRMRMALWLAVAFAAFTVEWTGLMVASLKWGFLDRFSVGMPDGGFGVDFFQVPRGFENLFYGNSIFLTELSHFGPYSTPYMAHPCPAVVLGSWTSWLGPWPGYYAFVGLSLGLLLLGAWLLASVLEGPAWKAFAYFAMFCSIPVYYMLWAGQIHVLLVLAVALVLAGLMRLERGDPHPNRYLRWIQAGILISLLSKPAVVFMLPVLLVTRETRKCVLPPVVIYAAISLLFLTVPVLNPGGYNGRHWINMVVVSLTPKPTFWLSFPATLDLTKLPELYALPMLFHRLLGHPLPSPIRGLPAAVILGLSAMPLVLSEKSARLRAAVMAVCLCVLMHYLAYYAVFEYQYATLLPLLPAHVWLWQRETVRRSPAAVDDFLCGFPARLPADAELPRAGRSRPVLAGQQSPSGGSGRCRFPVSGVLRRGTGMVGDPPKGVSLSRRDRPRLVDSSAWSRGWRAFRHRAVGGLRDVADADVEDAGLLDKTGLDRPLRGYGRAGWHFYGIEAMRRNSS